MNHERARAHAALQRKLEEELTAEERVERDKLLIGLALAPTAKPLTSAQFEQLVVEIARKSDE